MLSNVHSLLPLSGKQEYQSAAQLFGGMLERALPVMECYQSDLYYTVLQLNDAEKSGRLYEGLLIVHRSGADMWGYSKGEDFGPSVLDHINGALRNHDIRKLYAISRTNENRAFAHYEIWEVGYVDLCQQLGMHPRKTVLDYLGGGSLS